MIETRPSGEGPETTQVLRVAPEEPEPRCAFLRATLWWVLPATAMIAGGSTGAVVLVAADGSVSATATLTCGVAAAVALFGGMCVFERLVGTPGAALGIGVTLQLIHSPFVGFGIIPGWSASAGWVLTAVVTGALTWRAHTRRPPVIRTAEPMVAFRAALDDLVGSAEAADPEERGVVSGRFRCPGGRGPRCKPWSCSEIRRRRSTRWWGSRPRRAGAPPSCSTTTGRARTW
jgi:hypothetical protein